MSTASAVVSGFRIPASVIVIEDQMLAFVSDDIGYTIEILCVLRDHEGHRTERHDHSRSVNKSTLIILRSGVLSRSNSDIRRVLPGAITIAVCISNENGICGVVQIPRVPVLASDCKKIRQSLIDCSQHGSRWPADA